MTISFRISPASARRAVKKIANCDRAYVRWAQPFPRTGCDLSRELIVRTIRRTGRARIGGTRLVDYGREPHAAQWMSQLRKLSRLVSQTPLVRAGHVSDNSFRAHR